MRDEAAEAGHYKSRLFGKSFPVIQIVTVEGLLDGTERIDASPHHNSFTKASVERTKRERGVSQPSIRESRQS